MASLPEYVTASRPVPQDARSAWYKNTAQTYAGIMLWVVFWRYIVVKTPAFGGSLAAGAAVALLGVLIAALLCHFLTYLVPGMLGMKTGRPLYLVGTSTYGVHGGFIMPGFLMGCLQFGWLAVNACIACQLICESFGVAMVEAGERAGKVDFADPIYWGMGVLYVLLAVGVGLKGIQYVAKVATFTPLIPLAILVFLLIKTASGLGGADFQESLVDAHKAAVETANTAVDEAKTDDEKKTATETATAATASLEEALEQKASPGEQEYLGGLFSLTKGSGLYVMLILSVYIVGFFATAGAAGADFGMNNRGAADVHLGGLVGIVGSTVFAGGVAILVVAGAYGSGMITDPAVVGELDPVALTPSIVGGEPIMGLTPANWMKFLLALACFAPACFPAFIAANSFRTTMPNFGMVAVAIGTAFSIFLTVTGYAENVIAVFTIVGASFGPI
ncbi:MAG: hypothetical protein HQ567_31660, partial [Candidatus Nealsonbacteria bacterium]|nr:hypothetical protein [Candidatus Nealsonbacteria bacterium]